LKTRAVTSTCVVWTVQLIIVIAAIIVAVTHVAVGDTHAVIGAAVLARRTRSCNMNFELTSHCPSRARQIRKCKQVRAVRTCIHTQIK
jgi:hypothetical protein